MRNVLITSLLTFGLALPAVGWADEREQVDMPEPMQSHMLANMRDHLVALNEILAALNASEFDTVARIAEARLGMSSLQSHGAQHMAEVIPRAMQEMGMAMHQAASGLARTAQEGEADQAYRALQEVTATCVACHAAYRIR